MDLPGAPPRRPRIDHLHEREAKSHQDRGEARADRAYAAGAAYVALKAPESSGGPEATPRRYPPSHGSWRSPHREHRPRVTDPPKRAAYVAQVRGSREALTLCPRHTRASESRDGRARASGARTARLAQAVSSGVEQTSVRSAALHVTRIANRIRHEQPRWPREESNLRTRIRSPKAETTICSGKLVDVKAARHCARHSRVARSTVALTLRRPTSS
jgi:hypothetical protein